MEEANNKPSTSSKDNLDALLDSSLNDFNKPLPKMTNAKLKEIKISSQANDVKTSDGNDKASLVTSDIKSTQENDKASTKTTDLNNSSNAESAIWSDEFQLFQQAMGNYIENDSQLSELMNMMGNNLNEEMLNNKEDVSDIFTETFKNLAERVQNIPEPTPEQASSLLNLLELDDSNNDGENIPDLLPYMQDVMKKLMSKELLYPSIKEIVNKYPEWLNANRNDLKENEFNKYSQQFDLMKLVCEEFEKECPDTEEAKKARFEHVLELMQKIQTCGNPPNELLGDIGQTLPLEQGNLNLPGIPQQCNIM